MSVDKIVKELQAAMKLTTKSEYSILALIYIARHQKKGFVKIEEICSHYDISKKYLELLLTILKQNRYLKTRRGSAGGYALAKSPSRIIVAVLGHILRVIAWMVLNKFLSFGVDHTDHSVVEIDVIVFVYGTHIVNLVGVSI